MAVTAIVSIFAATIVTAAEKLKLVAPMLSSHGRIVDYQQVLAVDAEAQNSTRSGGSSTGFAPLQVTPNTLYL